MEKKTKKTVKWVENVEQVVEDYQNREFEEYLQGISFNMHSYKLFKFVIIFFSFI